MGVQQHGSGQVSPYQEALDWIRQHPGTGSAASLAKLVMSLWNEQCAFSFRECIGPLDGEREALAVRMVTWFAERSEDAELVRIGHEVCKLYPRVWDLGMAADTAKQQLREQWRGEDAKGRG